MLYNIMPENLYPQLPSAPPISQESYNIEMVRKYYQDIANLKEKYNGKQWKYKNAYNRLLHASTSASTVGVSKWCFNYWNSIHCCRLTHKRFTRCCEHHFNLCWWCFAVNI